MSNKTDLQENNKRIEDFIAESQELPPAMPSELGNATPADVMNGKTFTSNGGVMQTGNLAPDGFGDATAEDVLIGRTFTSALGIMMAGGLNPESLKQGQYVWKKYEIDKSTEILNPKFTADFVPSRDPNLKIINKNFGMPTEATYIDFFDGFKDSSGRVFAKDGDRLKTPWGYVYTYYESQNAMHLSTTSGTEQPTEFTFTGTKQITTNEQMKNYVGYIVSDNESAYPDGGEKDGYWYEKVIYGIGIIEKFFKCTEYAKDTFTLSANSSAYETKINHSLGKVPKLIFLYTEYDLPDNYIQYAMIDNTRRVGTANAYFLLENSPYDTYGFNTEGSFDNTKASQPTSNSFCLGSTYDYHSGIEYTVITMA